jgi:two-component system, chemotaxis family, protein-glutamate methylesterase/glutaminase
MSARLPQRRLRVLIVEDSLTVRSKLREVLERNPEFEVIGEAGDGKNGIDLCERLRPDVVTMDMVLPIMSGLAATEYIMAHCPTPILIVSSSSNRGEIFKTYEALAAGAVDVLEKPGPDDRLDAWERKLAESLRRVASIRVITHLRGRLGGSLARRMRHEHADPAHARPHAHPRSEGLQRSRAVAIGASTGGPGALVEVLRALPRSFPMPVLVVLHISKPFGAQFAEWLDSQTAAPVVYARDGESLAQCVGRITLAPPDWHLLVRDGLLRLTQDAERNFCRPSVDVLFESLAQECGTGVTACLLTGMGRDGAVGLLEVRKAGGLTIAQNEETCVVYGMPREAALLGAAERILPLGEIGPELAALTAERRSR